DVSDGRPHAIYDYIRGQVTNVESMNDAGIIVSSASNVYDKSSDINGGYSNSSACIGLPTTCASRLTPPKYVGETIIWYGTDYCFGGCSKTDYSCEIESQLQLRDEYSWVAVECPRTTDRVQCNLKTCANMFGATRCVGYENQQICTWNGPPICKGTPVECAQLSENDCIDQIGCRWVGETRIPYGWVRTSSTTNVQDGLSSSTEYLQYNYDNGKPSLVYSWAETPLGFKGVFTETTYAFDVYDGTTSSPDPSFNMRDRNMLSAPYEVIAYEDTNQDGILTTGIDKAIQYSRTLYNMQNGQVRAYASESWIDSNRNGVVERGIDSFPTTSSQFDAYGNVISSTDELGRTTLAFYGDNSNPCSNDADDFYHSRMTCIRDGNLQYTKSFYNPAGTVSSVEDSNGQRTTYWYDKFNRLVSVFLPGDTVQENRQSIKYEYNYALDSGSPVSESNPNSVKTYKVIDRQKELVSVSQAFADGAGKSFDTATFIKPTETLRMRTWYNALGQKEKESRTFLNAESSHSGLMPLASSEVPSLPVTTYNYLKEPSSRIESIKPSGTEETDLIIRKQYIPATPTNKIRSEVTTDEKGTRSLQEFDALGNMIRSITAEGTPDEANTTYEYDILGRVTKVVNARLQNTITQYDTLGRPLYVSHPDAGTATMTYNLAGQITERNRNGQRTCYSYDALDRLTGVDYACDVRGPVVGMMRDIQNFYDEYPSDCPEEGQEFSVGRQTASMDASGLKCMFYDARGNLIRTWQKLNSPAREYDTRFWYDDGNNLMTMLYNNGDVVSYVYDMAGRLERLGLAPNPGFEVNSDKDYTPLDDYDNAGAGDYLPNGWASQGANVRLDGTEKYSGIESVKLGASSNVYTDIPLKPGQPITVSAFAKTTEPSGAGIFIRCADTNHNEVWPCGNSRDAYAQNEWSKVVIPRFTVEAANNAVYLRIICANTNTQGNLWCDNLAVNGETVEYEYDSEGRLAFALYNNGVITSYSYDLRSRIAQTDTTMFTEQQDLPLAGVFRENLMYDEVGNVISITTPDPDNKDASFLYDRQYRLTSILNIRNPGEPGRFYEDTTYQYDKLGNRLFENNENPLTTVLYTYDSVSNRLVSYVEPGNRMTRFTYDSNGNTITRVGRTEKEFCAIDNSREVDGSIDHAQFIFNVDSTLGSLVRVVFDSGVNGVHYEWNGVVVGYTGTRTCTPDSEQSTPVKNYIELRNSYIVSGTTAPLASWYDGKPWTPLFKAYGVEKTQKYYYNYDNQLVMIDYGDGTCSKYVYDADGNRVVKKDPKNTVTYVYANGNPILDETFDIINLDCTVPSPVTAPPAPITTSGKPKDKIAKI
ncbi:MAG: hypothetical protein ABIA93_00175, partial [Candidatus Woesearchaeota archaeon]